MNIQDQVRLSSVKRWHIIDTLKEQSVAEHTLNVMLIVREVYTRLGWKVMGDQFNDVLDHDMDEVLTGDIPSPAKPKKDWSEVSTEYLILKACDIVEGLVFINHYGMGPSGDHARRYMMDQFNDILPHLDLKQRTVIREVYDQLMYGALSHAEET